MRDLADLHLLAMTRPEAGGQRFLAVAGPPLTYPGIARLLRARGFRLRTRSAPDSLFRLAARLNPRLRPMPANLGVPRAASAAKARRVLGWSPRPVVDTARSLV
ncbi:nucleoside-diphosphate-sugar epimerase [Crossiella equi]|uniref:Nucleoside-diphosphate-sugar epimerase n=1 Tax=Crossiella equi TaxID=130796 RepID=A0ABS5AK90_9PSEU|nr:nucleoside-diphosphate-sugar epimerase [Crossiella equi]